MVVPVRCAKCGNELGDAALFCPVCGAVHGAPAPTVPDVRPPPRPATTVDDLAPVGAASVARVLALSRTTAAIVRLFADAVRAAAAVIVSAAVWGRVRSTLSDRLEATLPPQVRGVVLDAMLVLLGAAIAYLAFRVTTRRFVRPLRS